MNAASFKADYAFVITSGEFGGICPALRYVASINLRVTQREFIEAAAGNKINPNTAAIQFRKSRKISTELGFYDELGINPVY